MIIARPAAAAGCRNRWKTTGPLAAGDDTALSKVLQLGYAVALLFLRFGGPDLAITQILVETLIVLCFVLVVYKLPGFQTVSTYRSRGRDALVSIGFGAFMTVLVMKSLYLQLQPTISDTLSAWSYPEAKGKNVVNVILVDFRGLDTLGEITVLAAAALACYALIKLRPERAGGRPAESSGEPEAHSLAPGERMGGGA